MSFFAWFAANANSKDSNWRPELEDLVSNDEAGDVSLDLREVEALTSFDLNELIRIRTALDAKGRRLIVVNASTVVYETFKVTRLDRIIEVHPLEETATDEAAVGG